MICRPIECSSLLVMQPQCRVQWSRAKLSEAASTCRPCQPVKEMVEEEEGGGDKPIDRCNRSVWQLFSYLVCSICVKSPFCFSLHSFSHFIIIIFMQFGVSVFGFCFVLFFFFIYFQQIWSDVATVGGVEVQPNEWHPQRLMSLMVLLAKCRQTLAELIRIRIEVRVRVRIS